MGAFLENKLGTYFKNQCYEKTSISKLYSRLDTKLENQILNYLYMAYLNLFEVKVK